MYTTSGYGKAPGSSTSESEIAVPLDTARGPLRTSVIGDLLVVHRVDRGWSWVYDVRCPQSQAIGFFRSFDNALDYISASNVVLDRGQGRLFSLELDLHQVLAFFERNFTLFRRNFVHQTLEESILKEFGQQFSAGAEASGAFPALNALTGGLAGAAALATSVHTGGESASAILSAAGSAAAGAAGAGGDKGMVEVPPTSYEEYLRQVASKVAAEQKNVHRRGASRDALDPSRFGSGSRLSLLSTYLLGLLLRRPNSRDRVRFLLERALENRLSLEEWAHDFGVLNQAYRAAIDAAVEVGASRSLTASAEQESSAGGTPKKTNDDSEQQVVEADGAAPGGGDATKEKSSTSPKDDDERVSVSALVSYLRATGRTALTDKDVVLDVFIPFFHRCHGSSAQFVVEVEDSRGDRVSTKDQAQEDASSVVNSDPTMSSPMGGPGGARESSASTWRDAYQLQPDNLRPIQLVHRRGEPDSCSTVPCLRWTQPSALFFRRDSYYGTAPAGANEAAPKDIFAPPPRAAAGDASTSCTNSGPSPSPTIPSGAGPIQAPTSAPYLLQVAIVYLNSLLNLQIMPHRVLQCFLFDLCVYYEQFHVLQQLLHYHVLLDDPDLCRRLVSLLLATENVPQTIFLVDHDPARDGTDVHDEARTTRKAQRDLYLKNLRKNRTWLTQAALDMALRFRDFFTVADILVLSEQYVDAIFLIKQTQLASYPLAHLLQRVFTQIADEVRLSCALERQRKNASAAENDEEREVNSASSLEPKSSTAGEKGDASHGDLNNVEAANPSTTALDDVETLLEQLQRALAEGARTQQLADVALRKANGEKSRSSGIGRYVTVLRSCLREIRLWQQQAEDTAQTDDPLPFPNIADCEFFGLLSETSLQDHEGEEVNHPAAFHQPLLGQDERETVYAS
ncbi:unnamed protein product [Amoebophrya sp. A25]|nr:unnamed protein product [Amoebophrya sp. A25]|eukprot:GSA25T00011699001.1